MVTFTIGRDLQEYRRSGREQGADESRDLRAKARDKSEKESEKVEQEQDLTRVAGFASAEPTFRRVNHKQTLDCTTPFKRVGDLLETRSPPHPKDKSLSTKAHIHQY